MKSRVLYLLDTDICIYTIKKQLPSVVERVKRADVETICVSSVTVAELEYGLQKSKSRQASRESLLRFLVPFQIIDFTAADACEYGILRAQLEAEGKVIGPYDMQIAAQAIARHLTLVTNNTREYARIPHLKIENWVQE